MPNRNTPSADAASAVHVNVPARPAHSYNVRIAAGIRTRAGEAIAAVLSPRRVVLLTDDTVEALYADTVEQSLTDAGFTPFRHVIPHGEASKSAESLLALLQHMAEEHLTRADCLVALGGGVVGDLGGFAASIYQRGIPFVQIPTTLLAMVDASVGGKTAIDIPAGKNLVGAFHQPSLVLCDPECLDTLPPEILADGFAEVIKYAIIRDRVLYDLLRSDEPRTHMEEIIRLCVEDKRVLVEEDETDKGARQLLNLGHTVGHAIESCSDFTISHGSAVAIGTVIIIRAAESLSVCAAGTTDLVCDLLVRYGLPVSCPFTTEQLFPAALSDKKRAGSFITLAIPYGIGDTRLVTVPVDALESYIRTGLED